MLSPLQPYILIGKLVALLGAIALICYQSSQIHRWHVQNDRNVAAREADRARYKQAQKDASVQNIVQVQRIEAQQQKVTDDVETRYRSDLARLRADGLRSQPAAAPGATVKPGSPAPVARPSGPTCETVSLPAAELLRAQETELQLNALIDLVNQQSEVDPNELREPQH